MPELSSSKKRKLTDYFATQTKKSCKLAKQIPHTETPSEPGRTEPNTQASSKASNYVIPSVPGLELHRDFITPEQEQSVLAFLNDDQHCKWRTDLSRRTMHFGGDYCIMPKKPSKQDLASPSIAKPKPQIVKAPDLPSQLTWLLDLMNEQEIYPRGEQPQYCIVNEYRDKLGISAHTENFSFVEPVAGLSLLSPVSMRFHELSSAFDGSVRSGKAAKAPRTGKFVDVLLPSRSLVVMRGPSRWSWQHEILRSGKGRELHFHRVSLTFRLKRGE